MSVDKMTEYRMSADEMICCRETSGGSFLNVFLQQFLISVDYLISAIVFVKV